MTKSALAEMVAALVAEMKKPYVDDVAVKRLEDAKKRMQAQRAESLASIAAGQANCSHLREDNTSRIAWIENFHRDRNLYIKEGFCQVCNKHYHPGVEDYAIMLKIPTGKAGLVY